MLIRLLTGIAASHSAHLTCPVARPATDPRRPSATRTGDGVFRGARAVDPRSAGGADRRPGDVTWPGRVVPRADPGVRSGRAASQRDRADQPARAGRGRRAGSRARRKRPARPAARHPGVDQGQLRHRRHADLRRVARARHAAAVGRRLSGAQAARGRRGDPRQDDDARARLGDHQHFIADQPDAKPLRLVSHAGRIERRHRRRDRRELRRRRHGQRHLRIDPHSRPPTRISSACAARTGCRAAAA